VKSGAKRIVGGAIGLAVVGLMAAPGAALAATVPGTAVVTLGTLSMVTPSAVGFAGTLTGVDQVVSTTQPLDILDATGSGAGWNVTLTSTQFTTATVPVRTLPDTAVTDISATGVCDSTVTCTLGDNTLLSYPVSIPAAASAPTAIKIQTASLSTGLGGQTWTHTMHLALAGNTKAGSYASTWTYSLVSAP
jgi:hypothetical protein